MTGIYHHTETKTLVNGTAAVLGSYEITSLPQGYKECVGVLTYPHQALFNIRLGMKQGMSVVQELVHPNDWYSDPAISYHDRFKPIKFDPNMKITVYYQPLAALAADQTWDFVFLLR